MGTGTWSVPTPMIEVTTMELPLQIAFHNTSPSPTIEAKVRDLTASLLACYDRIVSCRVVVDVPHRHHKEGNLYQVRVDIHVPGGELVVKRDQSDHFEFRDIDVMLHDAFEDARRQLDSHVRRLQGHVKTHEPRCRAKVSNVFPDQGFGFLETIDGREIYFHQHSVMDGGFAKLEPGVEVAYVEEEGIKGPQASTVRPLGRHNHF